MTLNDLQGQAYLPIAAIFKCNSSAILQHLTTYQQTQRVARSLCGSYAGAVYAVVVCPSVRLPVCLSVCRRLV